MAIFFFSLHECGTVTLGVEGIDYADLGDARASAIASARDVMSEEVKHGRLCLNCYIAIADAQHAEIDRVMFRDAIVLTGI